MMTTIRRTTDSAFSLVEVTLAMGLVSFVLVALLGLFGVALKSGRSSAEGTLLPQIIQSVIKEAEGATPPVPGVETLYYFDSTGAPLTGETDSVYRVAVTARVPDEASELPFVGARMLLMTMNLTYPGGSKTVLSSMSL